MLPVRRDIACNQLHNPAKAPHGRGYRLFTGFETPGRQVRGQIRCSSGCTFIGSPQREVEQSQDLGSGSGRHAMEPLLRILVPRSSLEQMLARSPPSTKKEY